MKSLSLLSGVAAFVLCSRALCQVNESEPIPIPEVIITESNSKFFSEDQTTISVGKNVLPLNRQQNLGIILGYGSPALIRSYGSSGSLMSLSLHGTGTNHASVSWNGFPINSPSTGQADLSLIPFGFMQSVDIINGASGALNGSGTFGGLVELTNEPDWNNRFAVSVSSDVASFHTRGHYLSLQTGGTRMQYNIAMLSRKAQNDFVYEDVYRFNSPEIIAEHNFFQTRGIIQNLYLNAGNGNYIEGGTWLHDKLKELPPLMGSYRESNALQKDKNYRTYLNYRKNFIRSSLLVKTAYFFDYVHYTDKFNASDEDYSVNSKITIGRIMSGIEYRHSISSVFTAGAGGSFIHNHAVTNNYYEEIKENEYAVYANLKIKLSEWIINTSVRQEFYCGINPVTQYSMGIRFKAIDCLILRMNLSNKFRKPTLNEKYWRPGGNIRLRPEKGWGADFSVETKLLNENKENAILSAILTAYYQNIDNWIQWIVRDSLTPVEYRKVHARGAEAVINLQWAAGRIYFSGNINYGCNYSTIADTYNENETVKGNQLIYIPRHIARMNLSIRYKEFMAGFYGSLTGARETTENADRYARLPPYGLIDLVAGYGKEFRKVHAGINFRIENLLNTRYEAVRSYAMPGRAFHFSFTLDYHK